MGFVRCMGVSEDELDGQLQNNKTVSFTANTTGTIVYPDGGKKGMKQTTVIVDVPSGPSVNLQNEKTVQLTSSSNLVVNPDSGYDGMKKVTVQPILSKVGSSMAPMVITETKHIVPESGYAGFSDVYVTGGGGISPSADNLEYVNLYASKNTSNQGTGSTEPYTTRGEGYCYYHLYGRGALDTPGNPFIGKSKITVTKNDPSAMGFSDQLDSTASNPVGQADQKSGWIRLDKGDQITVSAEHTSGSNTGIICAGCYIVTFKE